MNLTLASWNVESIRAHEEQVLGWLGGNEPDIACLQETRAGARKFPRQGFEQLGYELTIAGGDDGRAGVAIASRVPLDDVIIGIPGAVSPLNELRSISATAGDLRIHTCYAPNGRKAGTRPHDIKLAWFALLAAWLDIDREDHPAQILLGDLNIAPRDIDIWEPHRYRKRNLTSPPERAAFERLLDEGAMVDAVRTRFGDQAVFTWWNRRSDFYATDRGWRLDHVLATPPVDDRIVSVTIDRDERGRDGAADHAPLLITIRPGD